MNKKPYFDIKNNISGEREPTFNNLYDIILNKSNVSSMGRYDRLIQLALEEDDFNVLIKEADRLLRSAYHGPRPVVDALCAAHGVYSTTQKQLAEVFAMRGDYDSAIHHLGHAGVHGTIDVEDFGQVTLASRLTEEETKQISQQAFRQTSPEYFMNRVVSTSTEGDVEGIEGYISLALRSLEIRGLIQKPDSNQTVQSNERQHAFMKVEQKLVGLYQQAYGVAVRNKVEEAIGYSISSGPHSNNYRKKISTLRNEAQDLLFEMIMKLVSSVHQSNAYTALVHYSNVVLHPLFDELLECSRDTSHPLRDIFEVVKEDGEIVGIQRVDVESTALVPVDQREDILPRRVHPFYQGVLESYRRN